MEGYKTNYRVLIADDDPNVHQSLSPYFRREGYEIFSSARCKMKLQYPTG